MNFIVAMNLKKCQLQCLSLKIHIEHLTFASGDGKLTVYQGRSFCL